MGEKRLSSNMSYEEPITRETQKEGEAPHPLEGVSFERAVEKTISDGDRLMKEYSRRENRVFHTIEHPNSLHERGKKMADALGISRESRNIADIAISWHDVVMNVEPANPEKVSATIKRNRGAREGDAPGGVRGNEAESARMMERSMRRVNLEAGREVFSEHQIKTAFFAVEATYPGVELGKDFKGAVFKEYSYYDAVTSQNPEIRRIVDDLEKKGVTKGALFYQPHLEAPLEKGERVPEEVLIMVLDDLGGAGMIGREEFAEEGDREFRELYVNISRPDSTRRLLEGDGEKDKSDRGEAASTMLGWLRSQTSFVAWQMLRFEKIMYLLRGNGQITGDKEVKLRGLVSHFEDNIHGTSERAEETEKKYAEIKDRKGDKAAFAYLARAMHIKI